MPVCEKCKKDMPIQGFEAHQRFCKGKEQNPPELTTQDLAPEKVTSPTIVVPKKLKPEVDDEEQQEELLKLREEISKKNTTIERYKNIKNELDKLKEELETLKAGAITKIDIDNIKISIAETKLECKDLSEKNTQKIPVILRETEVISKRIDNINKDMVLPYEKIKEEKQNILIKLDKHIKETEDKDKNFELDITEIREDLKEKLITSGDILKIKEEFKIASELKEQIKACS